MSQVNFKPMSSEVIDLTMDDDVTATIDVDREKFIDYFLKFERATRDLHEYFTGGELLRCFESYSKSFNPGPIEKAKEQQKDRIHASYYGECVRRLQPGIKEGKQVIDFHDPRIRDGLQVSPELKFNTAMAHLHLYDLVERFQNETAERFSRNHYQGMIDRVSDIMQPFREAYAAIDHFGMFSIEDPKEGKFAYQNDDDVIDMDETFYSKKRKVRGSY